MNKFVIPEKYLLGRILSYKLKHVIPIIDYAVEHNADKHAFEQKYNQILHDFPNSYHAIKLSGIDLSSVIAKRIAHRSAYTCYRTTSVWCRDAVWCRGGSRSVEGSGNSF